MGRAAWVVREASDRPYGAGAGGAIDPLDVDAIEALGEEYVTLDAHIEAALQRSLAVLAEFDRLKGWELAGYPSCAHWVVARRRVDLHTARERVRTARALAGLPLTSAAMARGELSFCQVRELSRAATPDNEEELLTLARGSSVKQLERMIRAWKKGSRQDEAARERACYESRTVAIFPDDDGGYALKGRLTAEQGALLMRAIDAAGDALFRANPSAAQTDEDKQREAGQRRADGLTLLAERALAAGFGPPADEAEAPISGSRAERYQVVLHVQPEALAGGESGLLMHSAGRVMSAPSADPGMSELEDGARVPRGTSRRLSCDATVVTVSRSRDGTLLDVGRRTRTIPWRIRCALEIRDRSCRFPGCGRRFTDGHHVKHWADGGETSLDNCVLLCGFHHRLMHEGRWTMGWDADRRPIFFDPRGPMHYDGGWQPPVITDDAVAALFAEQAASNGRSE
jgi:hypothetical protein